jgi:uncharacterized membrane protein
MSDTNKRTLVKSLLWRGIATVTTIVIALILTGSAEVALAIGGVEMVAKFLIYYIYERAWSKVKWGQD